MNNEPDPDLVVSLKQYAQRGIGFDTAKAALTNAGYSPEEIDGARSAANISFLQSAGSDALSPHAQAAVTLSNQKAQDAEDRLRRETTLAGLVGDARNPYTAPYIERFYSNLGLSYWKITIGLIAINLVVYYLGLPDFLWQACAWISGIYVFWVYLDRFWIKRKK